MEQDIINRKSALKSYIHSANRQSNSVKFRPQKFIESYSFYHTMYRSASAVLLS